MERKLTPNERGLLIHLVEGASFEGAQELAEQIDGVRVIGGTPTFLELVTSRTTPSAPAKDGPVPIRALVDGDNGTVDGEVLVWVTDGRLAGLELAWFTEEPPDAMPEPGRVRLE
jgi:hypothetical protein